MSISKIGRQFSAAALGLVALLGGCASMDYTDRIPFTDDLVGPYSSDSGSRQKLQYYLSDEITLVRGSGSGVQGIDRGILVSRSGKDLNEIHVPAGAPGVVVGSGDGWLAVSFAEGSYLYFVSSSQAQGSAYFRYQRTPGRYYLFAQDFDGQAGTVQINGATYQAVGGSMGAYLLVDRESMSTTDTTSNTLPGRWLYEPHQ